MFTINCRGRLLTVEKPLVMGIINVTPDSFYGGSRYREEGALLDQVEKMIGDGADMIDIGGQSTRPGSRQISAQEETERVIKIIEKVHGTFPDLILSVDTYRSSVATAAVEAGASIVNDISSGNLDEKMLETVARLHVPYICMHMQGRPETMQKDPVYTDVFVDIFDFFIQKTEECRKAGINDILIDPGFGFGKTIRHNFELLKQLTKFRQFGLPLMVGLSRKSTIYKTLGTDAEHALNGSTVMHTIALMNGADILRVHDVKEAKEAVQLFLAYREANG